MREAKLGLVLFAALAVSACEQRPPKAAETSDAGEPQALATALPPPEVASKWADLVRQERWADAARAVDGLPETLRATPAMRYLRARIALEMGDGALALKSFEGLESALPLLAQDVLDRRADAAFAAGRFKEAGEQYATRPGTLAQLKAARAFERALDALRARGAADRIVQNGKTPRVQEAEARALRLRLGGRHVREDAEDARWLAIEAPDLPFGEGALARLAALEPTRPLGPAEHLKRARVLSEAGLVDEAVKAIEMAGTPPDKQARIDRLRAKADVYYRSRQHMMNAVRTFDEVVNLAGPSALEDAFKAARALSRADHDDEAIERFVGLARRNPKSPFAEEALFLAGRLHLLHARYAAAAGLLDEHHKRYGGAARKEAARLRALSHLLANHHAQAIRQFEELSDDEREPLAAARARTMGALAAARSGDRTLAIARYGEVARSRPLSWPALVARARLTELGATVPPIFEPGPIDNAPLEPLQPMLPPPVDLLHRLGLDEDAELALREREAAITAIAPGRSTEALCVAYGSLGRAKRRFQIAQQIPQALLFQTPSARTRWSWECAYPSPFPDEVAAEEQKLDLPRGLLYAVMRQESGFDPEAQSPARAVGLLQLLPETARTVATRVSFPFEDKMLVSPGPNVKLGAHYLDELIDRFRKNVPLALAGYNGGPDNVSKWIGRLNDTPIDVFIEQIPYTETRGYVVKVMGNLARYAYLQGGEAAVPTIGLAPLEP